MSDQNTLDRIKEVRYHLHESFRNPVQTVRNRAGLFKLTRIGWGAFEIKVLVIFADYSEAIYYYDLNKSRER